jgi:hypothetical protein
MSAILIMLACALAYWLGWKDGRLKAEEDEAFRKLGEAVVEQRLAERKLAALLDELATLKQEAAK